MKNKFVFEGYPHEILLRLKAHQIRISQSTLKNENEALQKSNKAVIENNLLWNKDILSISFKGGDFNLINNIATVAQEWTKYANIKFDFGINLNKKNFREWVEDDSSDIRIGFEEKGCWSFVGNEALDLQLCPHGSLTMNLENFNVMLPTNWKRLILHEFGHALGFHHVHQSPVTKCKFSEKFYDDMAKSGWSQDEIDLNYHQLRWGELSYSNYDPHSIMHYFFSSEYLEAGKNSPCYIESENFTLSNSDKLMARKAYPEDFAFSKAVKMTSYTIDLNENNAQTSEADNFKTLRTRIFEAIILAAGSPPISINDNPKELMIEDYFENEKMKESLYAEIESIILQFNENAEINWKDMEDFETFHDFIEYAANKM